MLAHTEAIKEINQMKLYQKNKRLSSETKEIIAGTAFAALFTFDLSPLLCFIGLISGFEMTSYKTALAWIFAAQLIFVGVVLAVRVLVWIHRARAPKRMGVIGADMSRYCMEVRR